MITCSCSEIIGYLIKIPQQLINNCGLKESLSNLTRLILVLVELQTESVDVPMHEAARRGNLSFLRECLQQGVSATGLDSVGNTALHWACRGGHTDCVKELLALPNPPVNAQVSRTVNMTFDCPCQSHSYSHR